MTNTATLAPTTFVERVTYNPELASQILAREEFVDPDGKVYRQRRVSPAQVKKFAESMSNYTFDPNASGSIKLTGDKAENSFALDGQHRLKAIISSGCSVELWTEFNVPAQAFPFMDSGKMRSQGDVLAIANLPEQVFSISRPSYAYFLGLRKWTGNIPALSKVAVKDFALEYEESLLDVFALAKEIHDTVGIATGSAAAVLFMINQRGSVTLDESWVQGLIDQTGNYVGDPRIALRNTFIQSLARKRAGSKIIIDNAIQAFLFMTAWNDFCAGNERKNIYKFTPKDKIPMPA